MTDQTDIVDAPASRRFAKRATLAVTAGAAAIALGVGGFMATTAAFTDTETVTGNSVGTASLTIDGSPLNAPITVEKLLPGAAGTAKDVLTFKNTGSVDFNYTVKLDNIVGPTELNKWVPVTITAGGKTETGTLADPPVLPAAALAANSTDTVTVNVTVGLSKDADNTAQGKKATFDVVVDATQK